MKTPSIKNLFAPALGAPESKRSAARSLIALSRPAGPVWTPRDYASLARAGYERNVIAFRCIRLVAEAAGAAPLRVISGGEVMSDHPLLALLAHPNPEQSGQTLLESLYGFLQTAGNAYVEAALIDGEVRELYALRPDRMKALLGAHGWAEGWEYCVAGRKTRFAALADGFTPVLQLKLFHPTNDHYGMSPLEAAASAVDFHNAALAWNKALLDNAARPSGALVYKGPDGAENLTAEQFERLKNELSDAYSGIANAGRPLVLDGGLDWRSMSLTPSDMDFVEAKNGAAREIALAFGVPPQLLGIPGDNTYANYREANLAFWKQTVLPLVKKTAASLSSWLAPKFDGAVIECDAGAIEALSAERDAQWARVTAASFLSDAEKRRALGLPALDLAALDARGGDDE
ncbi:MAG: phage portal protein [Parvularculaceae bacterium]|nr:phage portal protein [Parvularculaceae bacterium]